MQSHEAGMRTTQNESATIMNVFRWLTRLFSNRAKALSFYKRGMEKARSHNHQGAIGDYTATIDMPRAPANMIAMALYNRALAYAAAGDKVKATADLNTILPMLGVPAQVKAEARRRLLRTERRSSH